MLDEYGPIGWREEKARLSAVAAALNEQPASAALFMIRYTKKAGLPAAKKRAAGILDYLTGNGRLKADRVKFIFSEQPENGTRIYLTPADAIKDFLPL